MSLTQGSEIYHCHQSAAIYWGLLLYFMVLFICSPTEPKVKEDAM